MQKFIGLFENRKFRFILLLLVVFLGFLLRVYKLYKMDGLWTDEIISYSIASQSFPFGILSKLQQWDIQPPLWFLLLNIWMKIFGTHDIAIRFFSVLPGVALIPVVYLAAKEIGSRKAGILAALLTSINSGLIYYSQEVRFYSLLSLLSGLSILFLIKLKNKPCLRNYIALVLINTAILYTASIGFIFVFLEIALFSVYIYIYNRKMVGKFILSQLIPPLLFIPYILGFINQYKLFSNAIFETFDWYKFNIIDVFITIQHWFSPVILDILSFTSLQSKDILANNANFILAFFVILPIILYSLAIIYSAMRDKFRFILCLIAVLYVLIEIVLSINGKIAIRSRYTMIIVPILIIVASYGFVIAKKRAATFFLASLLIFINLYFIVCSPHSAPKLGRDDSYRPIASTLKKYNLTKNDYLVMLYNGKHLHKYYNGASIFPMDVGSMGYDGKSVLNNVLDKDKLNSITRNNSYDVLKPYISSNQKSKVLDNYVKTELINKVGKNRYVAVVIAKMRMPFSEQELKLVTTKEQVYKDQSLVFMLHSRINYDIMKLIYSNFVPVAVEINGPWEIHILKNSN